TTMVRPGCRSMDCSPVVLSSLNTSAEYTLPVSPGEGGALESRLRVAVYARADRTRGCHDPLDRHHSSPAVARAPGSRTAGCPGTERSEDGGSAFGVKARFRRWLSPVVAAAEAPASTNLGGE